MGMFLGKGYRRIFADTPFFAPAIGENSPIRLRRPRLSDSPIRRGLRLYAAHTRRFRAHQRYALWAREKIRAPFVFSSFHVVKYPKYSRSSIPSMRDRRLRQSRATRMKIQKNDCRKTCSQLTQFANAVIWLRWFSQHLRRFG